MLLLLWVTENLKGRLEAGLATSSGMSVTLEELGG